MKFRSSSLKKVPDVSHAPLSAANRFISRSQTLNLWALHVSQTSTNGKAGIFMSFLYSAKTKLKKH